MALPGTRSPAVRAGRSMRIRCQAPKTPSTTSSAAFVSERTPYGLNQSPSMRTHAETMPENATTRKLTSARLE